MTTVTNKPSGRVVHYYIKDIRYLNLSHDLVPFENKPRVNRVQKIDLDKMVKVEACFC